MKKFLTILFLIPTIYNFAQFNDPDEIKKLIESNIYTQK